MVRASHPGEVEPRRQSGRVLDGAFQEARLGYVMPAQASKVALGKGIPPIMVSLFEKYYLPFWLGALSYKEFQQALKHSVVGRA